MSAEALERLQGVYTGYLEAYARRVVENGAFHGLYKFLLGNSTSSDRKADNAFYKAVEQAVAALLDADEDTVIRAVRLMLLETKGPDSTSGLMIEAAQGLAIPLAPRLPQSAAAAILADYRARYPKKRMLSPRQRELLDALEQAAK